MRYPPPVPAQFWFTPNEVTATMMFVSLKNVGPPESPLQVPPVLALFDNTTYVPSGVALPPNNRLSLIRRTVAFNRTRSACTCAATGEFFWRP